MALGDVWRISLVTQLGEQAGVNVMHYVVDGQANQPPPAEAVAEHFAGLFALNLRAIMPTVANYTKTVAQKIAPIPLTVAGESELDAGNGDLASSPLPRQVAGLISLRTPFAGRSQRGRMYLPFPATESNDDSYSPTGLYIGALNTIGATRLLTQTVTVGVDSITLDPVIFSRQTGLVYPITAFIVRDAWATQRRRGTFGRPNPPPL